MKKILIIGLLSGITCSVNIGWTNECNFKPNILLKELKSNSLDTGWEASLNWHECNIDLDKDYFICRTYSQFENKERGAFQAEFKCLVNPPQRVLFNGNDLIIKFKCNSKWVKEIGFLAQDNCYSKNNNSIGIPGQCQEITNTTDPDLNFFVKYVNDKRNILATGSYDMSVFFDYEENVNDSEED